MFSGDIYSDDLGLCVSCYDSHAECYSLSLSS